MNICELLLNIENEYNGHKQTTIKGLVIEDALDICKDLEEYTNKSHSFVLEVWSCGGFTLVQKDYFKDHILGHKDRIILGSGE